MDEEQQSLDLTATSLVLVGEPEQQVYLDFDTGSSETWVDPWCTFWDIFGLPTYEKLCTENGAYLPQQSYLSEPLNTSGLIFYGSGMVEIDYYRDNITFGSTARPIPAMMMTVMYRS